MNASPPVPAHPVPSWSAWSEFNRTDRRFPFEGGLTAWIGAAAAAHPDRPAVSADGVELTYRELDERSDRVSGFLRRSGVAPGSIVAVTAGRTVHPYVGMLAVLKSGCGYVPVDVTDPVSRLEFIVQDAGVAAVLAASDELGALDWLPEAVSVRGVLDGDGDDGRGGVRWAGALGPGEQGPAGPVAPYDPDRTCYIIYTSGTTGRPKGVRISEHSLLNFVHWFVSRHEVLASDRLCQNAPLTFDPSVQQIFPAWVTGACLLPVPPAELQDPFAMMAWLRRERITHLDVVTAHWHHLREAADQEPALRELPDLRWIIIGGETLHYHHTRHWHRIVRSPALLNNIYGPTEATVNATEVVVDPAADSGQIPIGVPLPNYRMYVVDGEGALCAPGVTGELLIAGDGLAQRYQSAAATERAFAELTLPDGTVERVYRSGDLARLIDVPSHGWMLEFQGRVDSQVKIRGFRIELEEVEGAAKSCPQVRDAAVLVRGTPPDQLVCCFVADGDPDPAAVRAHVARLLAAYQVPNLYLRLDGFPLTRNGKLDRAGLAALAEERLGGRVPAGRLPESPVEKQLAEVWASVLGLTHIGAEEDFFTIGGTSLLAMTMVKRLRSQGIRLDPATVFESPTVAGLAARCAAAPL
ncbi:non-ribosomal peptide synthetase [Streptomyces sp. ITFR-16]|uniref:non-ribosomal peptide synthetase n=1 Tax=Streptomyces sp. ITFR-16 TaxID=3075198 RepID=UPI00288A1AF2|nr:non-ribosomal peptide synthetase [Streptomyces sp. ITFR-16]WNI21501.1 non-ribosomal peptide synthetase [Streptomyces sp. ITFR-16]